MIELAPPACRWGFVFLTLSGYLGTFFSVIEIRHVKLLARLLFICVLGVALFAGAKPKPVPQVVPHFDLMLHCGVFAVLALLWGMAVSRRRWIWGLAGLLFLGAGLELWQGCMMPARTASLADMAANTLGVFVGTVVFLIFLARFLPNKN
ncbi:VanZ family protein [Microbulbifer pacificus]|uniref:VanZ-like domain-containing protein n=1 Tax=Microbulbifer pacificus TaxID=407164 RepID=A0AAU0MYD7_9GAMM|nr:hypothetical protein [Microbulbifer pacificus]WOX04844.1 hypothetical protein R5R33_14000 [Microbulbifer pacificus]